MPRKPAPAPGQRSLIDIAADIHKINVERKALSSQDDDLKKRLAELAAELQLKAADAKLTKGGDTKFDWKIEPKTVPQVANWDDFYAYIGKKGYFHLLQKRPTVSGCAELWGLGEVIPGVEKFTSNVVTVKEK